MASGSARDHGPMRSSTLARVTTILLALCLPIALVAAFVKGSDDDDTRTTDDGDVAADTTAGEPDDGDFFALAAEQTAAATHYRYEMSMEFGSASEEQLFDGPLATGERAGDRDRFVMDQSDLMAMVDGAPVEGDLTMEIITEPGVQYLRAPLFTTISEGLGDLFPPEMKPLLDLGDGWGRIDLDAVGAATGIPSDLTGSTQLDPADALAMMEAAVGSQREVGTSEVRGDAVTDYAATITFADLAGDGMDPAIMGSFLPQFDDDEEFQTAFDAMFDAPLELTISIDGEGFVRRLAMDLRKSMLAIGEALGEDPVGALGFSYVQIIEFYDYGDESITIEVPPIEETTDLTTWALEMADGFS